MNNVLITDDAVHKMRQYGMHSHVRNNDFGDDAKMRSKKNVEKFWEHVAPAYKKLFKDTKQFDNSNVVKIDPEANTIFMENGQEVEQKVLVIATGLSEDQDSIEGLKDAITAKDEQGLRVGHPLGHPTQWYNKAWQMNSGLDSLSSGQLPFVSYSPDHEYVGKQFFQPHLGMSDCMLESIHAQELDPRTVTVDYRFQPDPAQTPNLYHPLDKQDRIVSNVTAMNQVQTVLNKTMTKLDQLNQTAQFDDGSAQQQRQLMVQPPCKPAAFIRASALGDEDGFLDVDHQTLKHKTYQNILGVGQCTNVFKHGTFTTLMGIMKMADTACENACNLLHGELKEKTQDGFNLSPIVLGVNSSVVAETKYNWAEKEEFQGSAGISQSTPSNQGLEMIHTVNANQDKQIIAGSYYGGWTQTPDFGGH